MKKFTLVMIFLCIGACFLPDVRDSFADWTETPYDQIVPLPNNFGTSYSYDKGLVICPQTPDYPEGICYHYYWIQHSLSCFLYYPSSCSIIVGMPDIWSPPYLRHGSKQPSSTGEFLGSLYGSQYLSYYLPGSNWQAACESIITSSENIVMTNAVTLETCRGNSNSIPHQLTVTLNPSGGGSVTSSPAGIDCGTDCQENFSGNVILTETPADGWEFSNWLEGCNGFSGTQYTVNMTGDKEVKAVFKLLSFPLAGYTAYTAPVSAVFDHAATAEYTNDTDNHVETFKGESSDNVTYYPTTTCYAKDSNHNSAFGLGFNYTGVTSLGGVNYLCYNGHPGFDYPVGIGTDVYPAASGTVRAIVSNETEENKQTPGGNYVEIEHAGGYRTKYLHLHSVDATNVQLNQTIQPSVRLGTSGCTGTLCGGPHLHFQVNNPDGIPVDPYGWDGSGTDPYIRAINYNLWK